MRTLEIGLSGPDVERWQYFLSGQGFKPGIADGDFGPLTKAATKRFQVKAGLTLVDGIVGPKTLARARLRGFGFLGEETADDGSGAGATIDVLKSMVQRIQYNAMQKMFGLLEYARTGKSGGIRITNGWAAKNIVEVEIPQLARVKGGQTTVYFHRKGSEQLKALFKAWETKKLLDRVLTWDGAFVPRCMRGSNALSCHAFGTAFDINAAYNPYGAKPVPRGKKGSVIDLVPIAEDHGFYWGGRFSERRVDGMHFELGNRAR